MDVERTSLLQHKHLVKVHILITPLKHPHSRYSRVDSDGKFFFSFFYSLFLSLFYCIIIIILTSHSFKEKIKSEIRYHTDHAIDLSLSPSHRMQKSQWKMSTNCTGTRTLSSFGFSTTETG